MKSLVVLAALLLTAGLSSALNCNVSTTLVAEIRGYQAVVKKIIDAVKGPQAGKLYNDLTDFVDTFGARLSGTDNLERAIDDVIRRETAAGLTVSTQKVMVPKWTRGEESAELITPRRQKLTILGLGTSGNTTAQGITAPVILIKDFNEINQRKKEVFGKIVLFNAPFTTYSNSSTYRLRGPQVAGNLGAVAVLVRSVTPFSINTPHTGLTEFDAKDKRIPAAAITVEHANYLSRLIAKGHDVTVNIKMSATTYPDVPSRNIIGDIPGTSKAKEYVAISGHIDSWDVGQGALDNAGGAFWAWHSLALIKSLNLTPPARTIRSILWTAEELGYVGSNAYRHEREPELRNWTAAFESDMGVFESKGVNFVGTDEAAFILKEILSLLSEVNGTELNRAESAGSDIGNFKDLGFPLGEPYTLRNDYFHYHHTDADWIDVLNSKDLDQNLAIFSSVIYILANLSVPLPRRPVNVAVSSPLGSPPLRTKSLATTVQFDALLVLLLAAMAFRAFKNL